MTIWSAEIKELETLYTYVKGRFPELEKELEQLIKTEDANVVMLYSRRCLEVIITDLCECELKRPRKTEPLKGIIDKLHHEEKIPSHIIASMQNLNTLSTFGAHPKEFDPRQVKPVLNNLATILEWYLKYKQINNKVKVKEPETEEPAKVTITKLNKRKQRINTLIITVLIVIVIILANTRIFRRGADLDAMTNMVTIINEFGEEKQHQVFKEKYVHKLMILPFEAEETDTINPWLRCGILEGIREDLLQFQYIITYSNVEASHLQEQIKAAKINNCPYFLTGTYEVTDGNYRITSRLHQTINGSVEKERIYRGNNLFNLFDSISLQTRIDLGVSNYIINSFTDLPFREHTTNNPIAFKYYIWGKYWNADFSPGDKHGNYYKALKKDSTFALVSYLFAWDCHYFLVSKLSGQKYIRHAMGHRQRLPEYREIQTRILNYSVLGEEEKVIALSEIQYDLQPNNIELLNTLIDVYNRNMLYTKAEDAIKKLNKLVSDYPDYQLKLARSYLLSGNVNEGLKYTEKRIKENPEHTGFLLLKGLFHLHQGDLDNAKETFEKAMLLSPEEEEYLSLMIDHINFVRNKTLTSDNLQTLTGKYRLENQDAYFDLIIHNNRLLDKSPNQWGNFQYPLSDTSFIGIDLDQFYNFSYCTNSQGKVFKLIYRMSSWHRPYILWKQDSLIINAENLLEMNKYEEALPAFQKAYSENPEHYYLANYIKHLEFIQSQEYEKDKSILESSIGGYDQVEIYKENNQYFLRDPQSRDYQLLPISKDQFIHTGQYNNLIKIVMAYNEIKGLKFILNDGSEIFFSRIN